MKYMAVDDDGKFVLVDAPPTPVEPPVDPPVDPPIDPPVEPPVEPPVGEGAPIYAWCGGINASGLAYGGGGITAADLHSHGITGVVVVGQGQWWHPDYAAVFPLLKEAGLKVIIGKYVGATPSPLSPAGVSRSLADASVLWAAGKNAGATAAAIDCEPYGQDGGLWWQITKPEAIRYGQGIGEIATDLDFDEIVMYCSSSASFPGSYNELVWLQNDPAAPGYVGSNFQHFLKAMIDAGPPVTHSDAVFHHGPQLRGYTWETGAAKTVELCTAFDARLRASIMYWPDIDEGGYKADPGYPRGVTTAATEAARSASTGPITLYQHHLTDGTVVDRWEAWLAEITAGL